MTKITNKDGKYFREFEEMINSLGGLVTVN
jgi:hypothetical protein